MKTLFFGILMGLSIKLILATTSGDLTTSRHGLFPNFAVNKNVKS